MKRNPVTLRDVAREADVHPSTASRALNDHARQMVNPETVHRVLEAAKTLGYRPNSLARGLKLSRTFTIGMLIPDLTNPLFPPIVRGIEDALTEAGCCAGSAGKAGRKKGRGQSRRPRLWDDGRSKDCGEGDTPREDVLLLQQGRQGGLREIS